MKASVEVKDLPERWRARAQEHDRMQQVRWEESRQSSIDVRRSCADELEAALADPAPAGSEPCNTPERCRYDPVLQICDACGADAEVRIAGSEPTRCTICGGNLHRCWHDVDRPAGSGPTQMGADAVTLIHKSPSGCDMYAVHIDRYEAANVLAAILVYPETGDWHAQMRTKLAQIAGDWKPNPAPAPSPEGEALAREWIDVVFDGPPGPVSGRFVEVEGPDGASFRAGEWIRREDGVYALRITPAAFIRGERK